MMDFTLEPPFLVIKPFATEEEFYRLAGEDTDWEYLDGRIVMHSPASDRSDPRLDVREKLPRYREARIEEIWLLDRFAGRDCLSSTADCPAACRGRPYRW
jgi:hypothetical protein